MDKKSGLQAALNELLNFKVFKGLTLTEISELCDQGHIVTSEHKQVLYSQDEAANSFGVVLSGAYKLCKLNPNGEETIIYFSTPGDIIGAFIMPQENPTYPVSSVAMGTARFLKIPRNAFLQKWKQKPDLIFKIQNLLSHRMASLQMQKMLSKAPLTAKIAYLLLDLLNKYDGKDTTLALPLTRKEIADNLGAAVESVIRIMSDWSKKGFIETHDQRIRILKPEKIIEEMNAAPH